MFLIKMSTRRLRKLRAKAEAAMASVELERSPSYSESENSLDAPLVVTVNPFNLLDVGDSDHPSSPQVTSEDEPEPVVIKRSRKKKKKVNEDLEFDKLLSEFKEVLPVAPLSREEHTRSVLSMQNRFFSASRDLRHRFGGEVVVQPTTRKGGLVDIDSKWPRFHEHRELVLMLNNGKWELVFGEEYQRQQREFLDVIESFDPQALIFFCGRYPFHVGGLLQLGEVYKHHGEFELAADAVARAVWRLEKAFPPHFSYLDGCSQIDYNIPNNQCIFLALFRHIQHLTRQSCHRAALEVTKLLISLSPVEDPYCGLLMLDYFAIRSREWTFLVRFVNEFKFIDIDQGIRFLPSYAYSTALASFLAQRGCQTSQSHSITDFRKPIECGTSTLIHQAVLLFPGVIPRMLKKACDSELKKPEWIRLLACELFISFNTSESLEKLIELYIERSHPAWSTPDVR